METWATPFLQGERDFIKDKKEGRKRADNISTFQQNAADASGRAQAWSAFGQLAPTVAKVGGSIFSTQSPDSSDSFENNPFKANNL